MELQWKETVEWSNGEETLGSVETNSGEKMVKHLRDIGDHGECGENVEGQWRAWRVSGITRDGENVESVMWGEASEYCEPQERQ